MKTNTAFGAAGAPERIAPGFQKVQVTDQDIAQIRSMLAAGRSLPDVLRELGLDAKAVERALQPRHAAPRPRLSAPKPKPAPTPKATPTPKAPKPVPPDFDRAGIEERVWHQVEHGVDVDRLLPSREKRARDLAKKLDRPLDSNGYRAFVAGTVHTILTGKAPQARNAEVALIETVSRWRDMVRDLLPDRMDDLRRIVAAGIAKPAPLPRKD